MLRDYIVGGGDLDARDGNGWTLLHHFVDSEIDGAIQEGSAVALVMSRALIRAGANEQIADSQGRVPRDIARRYGAGALYDAISRRDWNGIPTPHDFMERCGKILELEGFDVQYLDSNRVKVSPRGPFPPDPSKQVTVSLAGWFKRRGEKDFVEEFVVTVRTIAKAGFGGTSG